MPSRRTRKRVGRAFAARQPSASHKGSRYSGLDIEIVGRGWLVSVAPARARGAVTIAIVPDARVRALNKKFRRKNANTDVLSFPADEPGCLGDIVISSGVAARKARAARHSVSTELRVLALHGLLHLLGYDHERDDGRMARLERRLRRIGGLREGLIERA